MAPRLSFCFLLLSLAIFSSSCFRRDQDVASRPVLKVNGQSLSAQEFAQLLADRLRSLSAFSVKDPRNVDKAKEDILREYIVRVITETYASEKKIYVSKEDLDAEVNKIVAGYGDQVSFRAGLAREGLTLAEWQRRLRFSLLERKVTATLEAPAAKPSEAELKTYYEQNLDEFTTPEEIQIRQIVVDSESAAKQIAEALNGRKKDFATLAREYSMTPESEAGGELGWVRRGMSEIFDQAFSYAIGHRSDVLKSPYGYHIYEVTGKRKSRKIPFAEAKDGIAKELLLDRQQAAYSSWLETQLQRTKVFKDQELIKSLSVDLSGS
jgi:peptidyl-prolyl cis-trans isomerase C